MQRKLLAAWAALFPGIILACGAVDSFPTGPPQNWNREAGPGRDAAASGGLLVGCDLFDPAKVYALGGLTPGNRPYTASVDPLSGAWCGVVIDFAFDPSLRGATLRSDGRMILATTRTLRIFSRDANLFFDDERQSYVDAAVGWSFEDGGSAALNDIPLATGCEDEGISDVFAWPDTGESAAQCNGSFVTPNGGKTPVPAGRVRALGFSRRVLVTALPEGGSSPVLTMFDRTGKATAFPSVRFRRLFTVRAAPDGFLVASEAFTGELELWDLSVDGSASRRGAYGSFPEEPAELQADYFVESASTDPTHRSAMTPDGTLYQIASTSNAKQKFYVLKRPLAPAMPELVYDDEDKPVRLDGPRARLVTGP